MSSFSFTAPFISEEQEQAERAAFSEKEEEELRNDLYGTQYVLRETEHMRRQSVALCMESLEQIPDSDKVEYHEALERAPSLVESESPPIAFLRCCKYDAWAAANRIVSYWKVRTFIFGPERAYQPMTLDEAMQEDVEYLEKAIMMILPEDSGGRIVFFLNRIKCIRSVVPRESTLRCLFYLLHVISESESAQKIGVVAMANFRGYDLYTHYDRIQSKWMFATMNAMPFVIRGAHCCTGSGRSVFSLILPVAKYMMGKHVRHRLVVHAGSDTELRQGMQLYGLEKRSIPQLVGGDYTLADFETWLKERREMEEQKLRTQQNAEPALPG